MVARKIADFDLCKNHRCMVKFVLKFGKAEMAVRGSWYCSTETVSEQL